MSTTLSPIKHAVDLRTLGSLDLRNAEGVELRSALAQGKRMALLSYLAIAQPRGFHRRDTLVGLFWPETDQRHARAALRQALHFLRQSLGPDVVLNRGPEEIGIDFTKLTCDVALFEEAIERGETERAADCYGGPLLKGFFVNDAPEFEKWLAVERDRLAQLFADTLRTLAEDSVAAGNLVAAVRWWKRLAIHDPYSSHVACQLMVALDASGDRAGAITHAQNHAEAVRTDLEVEPDTQVLELVDHLRALPSRSGQPIVVAEIPPTQSTTTETAPDTAEKKKNSGPLRVRHLLGVALILIIGTVALSWFPGNNAAPGEPSVSLAVLPFENLGSPDDDYFVVGLAEDLVNRLAGMQRLNLVGPNDGGLASIEDAEGLNGAELNAAFLLRGSIERALNEDGSQSVRFIPSLVRVADGTQMWTDAIEANENQLFNGQVRIVQEVTRHLGLTPLSAEREWLRATPTDDPAAYDLFLLGNNSLRGAAGSLENALAAVDQLTRATERDPNFVQAHAKLAIAHTSMYWWNQDRTSQRLRAAKAAADRAVSLRPDMPNSHLALGWYYYWGERDYDRALRHFELARTNWPGVGDVLVLVAAIRRRQGDFERALEDHHRGAATTPSCATCLAGAGLTHLMLRDFEAAEEDAVNAMSAAPNLSYARSVGAMARLSGRGDTAAAQELLAPSITSEEVLRLSARHWGAIPRILAGRYDSVVVRMTLTSNIADTAGYYLAKAELATRMNQHEVATANYESARVTLERLVTALPDDPQLHSRLGLAYAGLGRREDAVREGTEATRLRPVSEDAVDGPLAIEMLARIYTMLGESDTAIDRLEMLLSIPSHVSKQSLRLDPVWAPLRMNERFARLTR